MLLKPTFRCRLQVLPYTGPHLCFRPDQKLLKESLLLKEVCHLLHVVSEVDLCVSCCATDSLAPLLYESFDKELQQHVGQGKALPSLPIPLPDQERQKQS